jgi:UDPglucose 6-dehydrogenase
MIKIGIIGLGFVGNAIKQSYISFNQPHADIVEIDTDPAKNCKGTYKDLKDADGVFICVPSPMLPNGACDVTPLTSVLDKIKDYKGVIISKVTAPPDVYKDLQKKFTNLVYIPEFLTANNAVIDYRSASYFIIGAEIKAYANEAFRIVTSAPQINSSAKSYICKIEEASMIKYIINSFLATKVVFMNEMQELAKQLKIDWNDIEPLVTMDDRIGESHTKVPGPDGKYGFGGMCFPKDTAAFLDFAKNYNVGLSVLEAAINKNLLLRLK